jgi:dipeptidyl-peptidase 4
MPFRPPRLACLALALAACAKPPAAPPCPKVEPPKACVAAPPSKASPDFPAEYAATQGYMLGAPQRMTLTEDGRVMFFLRASPRGDRGAAASLWETNLSTGTTRELLRPDALAAGEEALSAEEKARRERQRQRGGGFTFFEPSSDGATIILGLSGRLYAFARATGKARELAAGPGAFDPHLSPDATRVAYVRDHNVYVLSLATNREVALTRGGTELRPYGVSEFMAQEEFYRSRGFWWSPDGAEILYQETDLSRVPEWTYADPAHPDRPPRLTRYPKVGAPNAAVRLAIATPGQPGRGVRRVTWDAARYPYLVSVAWPKNAPPTLDVRDRLDQHAAVLAVDPKSGEAKELLTEEDATWLNFDPSVPRWLPDGSGFLWSTERNGSYELELRDRKGARVATVAAADLGYRRVLAVDGDKKVAYVSASAEPTRSEVWAVALDGRSPPRALAGAPDGATYANFGSGSKLYAFVDLTPGGAPQFGVRNVEGATVMTLASEAKAPPFLPRLELAKVGPEAVRVAIVRPRDFDPKKRYPVIDYAYGGPWNNMVHADAYFYLQQQWLADEVSAVVVSIDARGTELRGRAWQRAFYKHYGDLPVEGHAEAIAALAKAYPELDAARVGIYGWSNGGYVSAMAVLRRPDMFKAAVAGAPVADLRDYDAIMEFFLGAPPDPAYDEASLLTWAAKPPTDAAPARPLLLIHGTADDNVYVTHALKLAAALESAGRPVEFMPLVDQTHMVGSPEASTALTRRIAAHFRANLYPRCAAP